MSDIRERIYKDEAIAALEAIDPRRRHLERMMTDKFDWENGWDWGIDDAIAALTHIPTVPQAMPANTPCPARPGSDYHRCCATFFNDHAGDELFAYCPDCGCPLEEAE